MNPNKYSNDIEKFNNDGYVVIENFLTKTETELLRKEIYGVIDNENLSLHPTAIFSTEDNQGTKRDEYFLNSADKIRFFYEQHAFDEKGELKVDLHHALNKIGHALHILNPVFRSISFSPNVQQLMKALDYSDPAIVQSMYIFKQPGIGGEVTAHQDATFLHVEPIEHLVGLWFALEDATEYNGCLQFIPGSHKITNLPRRFKRTHLTNGPLLEFTGENPNYDDKEFVAAPVAEGGLVLIHGLVVHRSAPNHSMKSRHAYTFHVMERKNTKWDPDNWLQFPEGCEFPSLYE